MKPHQNGEDDMNPRSGSSLVPMLFWSFALTMIGLFFVVIFV